MILMTSEFVVRSNILTVLSALAVAKKLNRKYLGFDISKDYVQYGRERLEGIRVGDPLDGSPDPIKSAPSTNSRNGSSRKRRRRSTQDDSSPKLF